MLDGSAACVQACMLSFVGGTGLPASSACYVCVPDPFCLHPTILVLCHGAIFIRQSYSYVQVLQKVLRTSVV